MKKILALFAIIGLMFSGCNSKDEKSQNSTVTQEVEKKTQEQPKIEPKKVVKQEVEKKEVAPIEEEAKKEEPKKVVEEKKAEEKKEVASNNVGEALFKPCIACHGKKANKKALGKSQDISKWSKEKIVQALEGYKSKTYGGAMKNMMFPQVASLTKEQVEQVADYIVNLK